MAAVPVVEVHHVGRIPQPAIGAGLIFCLPDDVPYGSPTAFIGTAAEALYLSAFCA
jgi:hypothetical protein